MGSVMGLVMGRLLGKPSTRRPVGVVCPAAPEKARGRRYAGTDTDDA